MTDQLSLGTAAARTLSTTTKTVPQNQGISPRWLLRKLPWVEASGGAYRVNRRLSYTVGDGRVTFTNTGATVRVVPLELRELPPLRDLEDEEALAALAGRFSQREYEPGDILARAGTTAELFLIAHGKVNRIGAGQYGSESVLDTLADGDYFGEQVLIAPADWEHTVKAITACTVLVLSGDAFTELAERSTVLGEHIEAVRDRPRLPQNKHGEAAIAMAAGHTGETDLPGTFVDYEAAPREYELSLAQTLLRIHTRVADLYNDPMDQTERQLQLTIDELRERQEHELINNLDFGLLHNADLKQRIHPRTGPPTPEDMDDLLCRRRGSRFFLAHPRAIAAFRRGCSKRGIYPDTIEVDGVPVAAWRGVPMFPCDKIPITPARTSSFLVMRTGQEDSGVIGLHRTGLPDEREPGISVRSTGISDKAITSYLVSTYYSAAVLVPDALGILENAEIGG